MVSLFKTQKLGGTGTKVPLPPWEIERRNRNNRESNRWQPVPLYDQLEIPRAPKERRDEPQRDDVDRGVVIFELRR